MGFLQFYCQILLNHPCQVLTLGLVAVLSLFTITINLRPLPSFSDPLVGFEVRGTPLAIKLNTWRLLTEETSASANNLSLIPNSARYDGSYQPNRMTNEFNFPENDSTETLEPPVVEMSTQQQSGRNTTIAINNNIFDDGEEEYYEKINRTVHSSPLLMHYSLDSSRAFCGKLYEGYAQVVVAPSTSYSSSGLFNLNSMLATCQLDQRLRLEQSIDDSAIFQRDCERFSHQHPGNSTNEASTAACCNSWSLPNYISCLNNKTSCMDIDMHDLRSTEQLLNLCAPYYYRAPYDECFTGKTDDAKQSLTVAASPTPSLNILSATIHTFDKSHKSYCGSIPEKCLRCDGWIFNVLHFLTSENFIRTKQIPMAQDEQSARIAGPKLEKFHRISKESSTLVNKLTYTNIFLPIAKSSSLMKYYHALSKYSLKTPNAQVRVMNLGLKNSLFEHLISSDTKLFAIALLSILIVISIYTWSFILSLVALTIICLSLCLSYTIYELVLNIPVFPFMNLLAVVISFGICSDNAMLFCKHWSTHDSSNQINCITQQTKILSEEAINLDRMLKRAIISTSAATLATACSFIISAISNVTAVRCFCIFATLSVVTNYILIVLMLPPALILDSRLNNYLSKTLASGGPRASGLMNNGHYFRKKLLELGETVHKNYIFISVTKFKFYLIVTFMTLLICAVILVFHGPTLQPADEDDVQLLSKKHAFEQYDKSLRKQFIFEKVKLGENIGPGSQSMFQDAPDTLPVRVVFGLNPADNGNRFDAHSRGRLNFDPRFDITDSNAQIWLLEFCYKLRQQRFIHPSSANDMSNCFLDTFKSWMDSRSCQDPFQPEVDRSPCCSNFEFPYSSYTFNKCVGQAIAIMRKTPQYYPNVNAGVRFFKNSTRIAALIIEYQSNRLYTDSFTKMERFYHDINQWVSWQVNNTAPASLKSGWFVSNNLELLALQTELESSTSLSILLEVVFATFALMISTRDLVLTLAGTLTIGTIIIVTLASLVLLKWTLGVAESILISLTIGLSIDFALHYSVAYSEGLRSRSSQGVIGRILGEVGSPIALATITTSLAGFVIVWSDILAYQELGVFLILIACISWLTSTFFLLPMLATVDVIAERGEQYARFFLQRAIKVLIDRL